ncbi:hypothetical protein M405DRAFT_866716 [Rhizopogon salebrosus TDB-379]|nr:hypothetical protein M405DRAFT_866716 [Rhizopogon salebrosus TDB-379]
MSPTDDKDNPDPTAESTTVIQVAKGTRTKSKVLSASTKTVWKSNDDAVLVATLLKEREEGHRSDSGFKPKSFVTCAEALKGSEQTSGGIAKTSGSCHDHWGNVVTGGKVVLDKGSSGNDNDNSRLFFFCFGALREVA